MTATEALSLIGATLVALVWVILRWQERRATPVRGTKPPVQGQQPRGGAGDSGAAPKPIAPAVRAELDVTGEWWTDRYHQLLTAVGADIVIGESIETRTWAGQTAVLWQEVGWVDCSCPNCRRICA